MDVPENNPVALALLISIAMWIVMVGFAWLILG